jgi:hypothetical protein
MIYGTGLLGWFTSDFMALHCRIAENFER